MVFRLERVAEVDSTSSELLRRLAAGAAPGVALLARRQTGGRGRLGRGWASVEGNLFLSVAVALPVLRDAGQWSLLAGVAVWEALRGVLGEALGEAVAGVAPGVRLKWPNDVMVGEAKLGGILVEVAARPDGAGEALVIGVGVNVAEAPGGLGRPVVSLRALGAAVDAEGVAAGLLARLAAWVALHEAEGFGPVRAAWLAAGPALGSAVAVQGGVSGAFAGLGADGALMVDVGGRVVAVRGGEVM